MKEAFDSLRAFKFHEAILHLWVFKPSTTAAKYAAWYVRTDAGLNETLKGFVSREMERITEFHPYNYLAQTNENGCLTVDLAETNFDILKALIDRPEPEHQADSLKRLRGASGYIVKFVNDGKVLYAARRSPASWKTAYSRRGVINTVFRNGELAAYQEDAFTLEPNFDLFCLDGAIFIANKGGFESVMQHRSGYIAAFSELQAKPEFVSLFSSMQPLIDYVGTNSMQLRRMAVIQEKNLFTDPRFMSTLKDVSEKRGWNINFDKNTKKIVPCMDTAPVILRVLLDQRLLSEVTQHMYDVQDSVQVA